MHYFIIRHKPTGFTMPQSSRKKWGYTHDNPSDPRYIVPRLFMREQDAKCALKWWLKGTVSVSVTLSEDWVGKVDETWRVAPLNERDYESGYVKRRAEDMEIVSVTIPEISSGSEGYP